MMHGLSADLKIGSHKHHRVSPDDMCEYYLSEFVVTFTMRWLAECGAEIKMWSTRCTLFEYVGHVLLPSSHANFG